MIKLNPLIIAFIIITFFVFAITFTAFYTKENFSSVCGCQLPIWVIVISIASFGLFTGLLVYYFLGIHVGSEKKDLKNLIPVILSFLGGDEKRIVEFLLKNKGEVCQSRITKELGIDKVKTSRVIAHLEGKGLVQKEKRGMTNMIKLDKSLSILI